MVGIIVPSYNIDGYVCRCIQSLLSQTYGNLSIVLVDDGSFDSTGETCDKFARLDSRICVIHQPNGGLSAARNIGIDWSINCVSCDWLSFVDGDDFVSSDYAATLLRLAEDNGAQCAICGYINVDSKTVNNIREKPSIISAGPDEMYARMSTFSDTASGCRVSMTQACAKLLHKSLFNGVYFPLNKIHEDRFTTYRLLFQCKLVVATTEPLYKYVQTPNSITRSPWTPRRLDDIDALDEQLKYFYQQGFQNAYKSTCKSYVDVLNLQIKLMRESPYWDKDEDSRLRLLLKERIRIAKSIGAVGDIMHDPNSYCCLNPWAFKIFARIHNLKRLFESPKYRRHIAHRIRRMLT